MALDKTASKALEKIDEALSEFDLSDDQKQVIRGIIHNSIVKTIEETTDQYQQTAAICCGPEADLAHKIAEEIERKQKALIANLSAMR